MNLNLLKGKSKRTKLFTAITVLLIVFLIAANFVLSHFGLYKSIYFDMTPEGFYTLSDAMKKECDELFSEIGKSESENKIKITFCTDPDYLKNSSFARLTYFMSLKLAERYPEQVEVETVNVAMNPTAVAQYKTTSLSKITSSNVIISYGERYRVASVNAFWALGTSNIYHYNGEHRIVSLIKSVTAVERPSAYFVTDHGESYYDAANPESEMSVSTSAFADLLIDRGLSVKNIKLSELDAVPDDCVLLIINNPRTDFTYDESRLDEFAYISDTEKLDRYLVKKQGAIMVALDYQITGQLPVLTNFLYEWGFKFSDSVLVDKESSLEDANNTATNIVAKYSTDEESYAYTIYGEFSDLSSAPITVVSNSGSVDCSYREAVGEGEAGSITASRQYVSFLTTSASATRYVKDPVTGEITTVVDGEPGTYDLAALTVRSEIDQVANEVTNSYLFCANSADFFSNKLIGETSYANYDIVSAVIENISRIDDFASMDLGGNALNSSASGGKRTITMQMSEFDHTLYSNRFVDDNPKKGHVIIKDNKGISTAEKIVITSVIMAIPLAIGIVGIVVKIKRRYL